MTEPVVDFQVPPWATDPGQVLEVTTRFIAETVSAAGASGVVVGLSGGIDSAVSANLAARALGPDRVLGVFLPYATSAPASLNDARTVAGFLGIRSELVEITPMVNAWLDMQERPDPVRKGNVMARVRMIVLYDLSARDHLLVLGTGNRSEVLLGYTTLYGDSACAMNPLGKLYKTEVRHLARYLGLPEAVILKPPSADLWVGQTDEDELGFTYAKVDHLLHHLVDDGLTGRKLEALGFERSFIDQVRQRMRRMAFKRSLPPVAEIPGRGGPDFGDEPRGDA